jgi:hypothetical protein
MYNFQFTFIYPTSHKLNAMTYGFIFLFQNNFEYIFLCPYKKSFLIGFWVDYFFVYFTLPTPGNNYKKRLQLFFPNYEFLNFVFINIVVFFLFMLVVLFSH